MRAATGPAEKFPSRTTTPGKQFNKNADAPADGLQARSTLRRLATQTQSIGECSSKNATAMKKLLTEFKGKVEMTRLAATLVDQFRKLSAPAVQPEGG